ncbi:MAG: membrane protein insertase YidC [Opitutae bacterium]|nr:membrane protein insertase YidC [Opitutae bacterium]
MDKKNTLIGILFLVAAFALIPVMNWNQQRQPPPAGPAPSSDSPPPVGPESTPPQISQGPEQFGQGPEALVEPSTEIAETDAAPESLYYLENDLIEVVFTNHGGGIKKVAMKAYEADKDSDFPFLFNHYGAQPMLGVSVNRSRFDSSFSKTYQSDREIHFERLESNGLLVRKKFWINTNPEEEELYSIRHAVDFVNTTSNSLLLSNYKLHLGRLEPALLGGGTFLGGFLNVGYYEDGDEEFIASSKFIRSDGFLGFGGNRNPPPYLTENSRFSWASLKNQFFTAILTPDEQGIGVTVTPRSLDFRNEKGEPVVALEGDAHFELSGLGPNERVSRGMEFYVGPKEIFRLQKMDRNQEKVMQFGWFGAISKVLLLGMKVIHQFIPNWGVAIILITISLKILFWPLTQISARSAKKMQKIQGPMKEMQERYKDDPKRRNEEMMKLYRKHKVNPLGGCLPMLIQIPIFIGFFYMLRTSSELRFAEFLWIADLSQPEKLFSWGINLPLMGQYFNLLPILMGVTMFYQMRMTPTAASAQQQAIFKFMPVMMVVMLYNFSSGLCLYWTVQNLMTILQQTITNRRKDPEEIAQDRKAKSGAIRQDNPLIRKKSKRKSKRT